MKYINCSTENALWQGSLEVVRILLFLGNLGRGGKDESGDTWVESLDRSGGGQGTSDGRRALQVEGTACSKAWRRHRC